MSLSQALTTAVTGLHATQVGLALVSDNVANAETPGYLRKTPVLSAVTTGGVQVAEIKRELDQYIQRQLGCRLCRSARPVLQPPAIDLWRAGLGRRARDDAERFHVGGPGADDESRFGSGTRRAVECSTGPDAAAAHLIGCDPGAAQRRRARHWGRGTARQRGHPADRADQPADRRFP